MRTRKYKTLKGLLRQVDGRYLTYYDFVCRRFYGKGGWTCFVLSEDGIEEFCRLIGKYLWARPTAKHFRAVKSCRHTAGIFSRLWITKDGKADYCAGQDYPSEIRYVQHLIMKG